VPQLSANLTTLFNEVGFLDRFGAAASAGFTGVECQFPYEYDARVVKQKLDEHQLTQVLHNLPAGDWAAGERGIACLPNRIGEFEAGVARAIAYATTLGCSRLNCLSGIRPPDVSEQTAHDTIVRNLRFAAPRLAAAGIRLLIEPINTRGTPGFFLSRTSQALAILEAVQSDNLFLQYDVYHMHVMGEDVADTIVKNVARIGHIQIADSPGRHEPGTGQIDFPSLFGQIDGCGYAGWIGCEYNPTAATSEGLGWSRPYLQ
jgi:hydroxypyruvate isomerase